MRNAAFEEYYKAQDIVPVGEWEAFLSTLRCPLPVTFRINGSGKFADHLRDKLKQDFFAKLCSGELLVSGGPPASLPWYPNGYAWQLEFSRSQLRKMPLLRDIHDFVKHANDAGSISRQEAVSMVPPLFLDVQPHHRVLDMCAAPGSKTFQLLEAIHANSRPGQTPPGFVVANDADFMRCNLLTHQTKRVCSPCLLVTNHDASRFPVFLAGAPTAAAQASAAGGASAPPPRPPRYTVRFDRILADVPCSGDGTLRKSPDIWRKWNVGGGNSLHSVQLRIAMHGAKLLEVGGRMVYSTCTFNPVEDEAVVSELLLRCGGALELLDVSDCMPQLRRMAGKHTWQVRDRYRFYSSWDEARETGYKLEESMFSNPAKAALPLERCMRFLPHHGDTGGFFVAVLRKVSEL
ncbi:tRNA-methyltransferase, partial [Volvox carteri f. nagariensis]